MSKMKKKNKMASGNDFAVRFGTEVGNGDQ